MHWRAIQLSTGAHECRRLRAGGEVSQKLDGMQHTIDGSTPDEPPEEIPLGQDNTCDVKPATILLPLPNPANAEATVSDGSDTRTGDEHGFSQVPVPSFTTGTLPFAYERALRNRIRNHRLRENGEYNMRVYTPTFVHDSLMLPGSLANLLGKVKQPATDIDVQSLTRLPIKSSPEEIIRRMTPALLPGFCTHVLPETQQPYLLPSADAADYVQGMVVFGQGREGRDLIHAHYRSSARRVKVEVEIDVSEPVWYFSRDPLPTIRWRLKRRKIWAHAWLWSHARGADLRPQPVTQRWTLEGYVNGILTPPQLLRIEPNGKGDEWDHEQDLSMNDGNEDHSSVTEDVRRKSRPS